MNNDANFIFQGVMSFLGSCTALSDVLAAMSLAICFLMLLLVTVNSADMHTHSYNSNLEFKLRVFNCYPC